jgi:outer membrane autotransporter protein
MGSSRAAHGLGAIRHEIDASRNIEWLGLPMDSNASYAAGTVQAFGELGYTIRTAYGAFAPFAGVNHVHLKVDGFTESGKNSALSALSSESDVTMATLGARAAHDFAVRENIVLTAHGMLGWTHAFGDLKPESRLAFAGGDRFTIKGMPIAQDALNVEAGLDVNLSRTTSLGITYSGQFSKRASDNAVKADLAVRF